MTSELDRFKHVLATICIEHPEMRLGDALLMAADIEEQMTDLPLKTVPFEPNWDDQEERARWARAQPDLKTMPKINGIKEIRRRSSLGLKEAKETWELAFEGRGSTGVMTT